MQMGADVSSLACSRCTLHMCRERALLIDGRGHAE
ncbi:hypothetical protein GBAR_LOCUS29579 [Geodia barretti]|uniref:Uncharacterized protein n=1 Tax=Geodia barretti TaxID=519541 RepID=A0AA35TTG5_GEOBA|nr:hypothetical protein GBAR_LOCUS29579 [Geodia barretti]